MIRPSMASRAELVRHLRDVFRAASAAKVTALAFVIGAGVWARITLLQLRCLPLPISAHEQHHWRQSFTYGVAWNYAHATLDFFHPRMFLEGADSNVIAMEAPIYPYLGGLVMRLTGDGTFVLRLASWLSILSSAVMLFVWLGQRRSTPREAWSDRAGLLLALGVSISAAVDFRSVQPDPLAAGLALAAAFVFSRYAEHQRRRDLIVAAALTSLAVLTKPVVLGVVPALVLFGSWRRDGWIRHGLKVASAMVVALLPHALWDRWAAHLLETVMHGSAVISIQHDPKEMLANLRNAAYTREALLHFLPNYAASWWLVPALLAGTYRAIADHRLRRIGIPFLVWLAGYLTELIAFGDRLHSNAYYFVLAPAPLAFLSALGIGAVVELFGSTTRPSMIVSRTAAIALFTPLGVAGLKHIDWKSVDVNALGFMQLRTVWTSDLRLALLLVGSLVVLAAGASIRPRRVPVWLGLPLVFGFFASAYAASQTNWQFLRFYSDIEQQGTTRRELTELRAAVDKYSTTDDRIIISPEDFIWFYFANRNGFGPASLRGAGLDRARARGARLYLHMDPGPGRSPDTLLASGSWWKLYCIAADGCPARH